MKFTPLLKSIILENGKIEYLTNTYAKPTTDKSGKKVKPRLNKDELIALISADPETKTNNINMLTADDKELGKVKAGKYSEWLIKRYLSPVTERQPGEPGYEKEVQQAKETFMEDLYKVTNDLKKYERFKNRLPDELKDINKLTVKTLYDAVKDFSLEKTKASKEEKKIASQTYEHPGGKIAFRGPNWTVVEIEDKGQLGKDAACFYGGYYLEPSKGETRWCTSGPGLSYFERYIKDGPLYVVIPNEFEGKRGEKSGLPAERYQFHFPSNQFMDVNDHSVNLIELLNGKMKELKEYFKPEFAKGLTVGGQKLVIDSFSHGAIGKFIGLYGLEELIDSLPDTLTEFQIQNREQNNIIIEIPESIGRFKELNMVLFDNCVSSIPSSICELPKLRFLALINNPKLTDIPECVSNLPNLYFLNLRGSNNVNVPESIKRKGTDMGNGMWDLQE